MLVATCTAMNDESVPLPGLAPLQRVMLWDSHATGGAGHHVEQVEIILSRDFSDGQVKAAWDETVARTEALRIAFLTVGGMAVGLERVRPLMLLELEHAEPQSWESWLAADRRRPLLAPHVVPWRAVYWQGARRFVWTFHHALLDGRSMARILRGFLTRLTGHDADELTLSCWSEPSTQAVTAAGKLFREMPAIKAPMTREFPAEPDEVAVRCLGSAFAIRLDSLAAAMQVTVATLLTWSWGQALAETNGTASVLVEQLRAGPPQPGTAGFTMNTLPVVIQHAAAGEVAASLRELHSRLRAQREIESVSPDDFPPGVFPNMDAPGASVIMIERGTLQHLAASEIVSSLVLHEAKGTTLMATGYLLPDLRLEVEGPGRHHLLESWLVNLGPRLIH